MFKLKIRPSFHHWCPNILKYLQVEVIAIYHIVYHCVFFKCVCFSVGAHVWVDCCFGVSASCSGAICISGVPTRSHFPGKRFASLQVAGVDCASSVETKMVRSLLLGGTAICWTTVETVDVGKTSHLESPLADYRVISNNIIIHDDYRYEPSSIDYHHQQHHHCYARPHVKWTLMTWYVYF